MKDGRASGSGSAKEEEAGMQSMGDVMASTLGRKL